MKERGYCSDQRTIERETRHEEGCEILDGFENRAKNDVLHRSKADLGTIGVVTLPKSVVEDTANLELSRFDFLGDIMAAELEIRHGPAPLESPESSLLKFGVCLSQ